MTHTNHSPENGRSTSLRIAEHLELWPIHRLTPSARNARTHSAAQVAQLAGSIAAYGFIVPVVVDPTGGIIAGHARVLAAAKLKLKQVPVIIVDHLSESEKRAYAIADNKLALNAGWDDELLKVELAALASEGFDLTTIGFSEEELNSLVAELGACRNGVDEDAAPEVRATTISRPGDLWELGSHRLLCGDATVEDDYIPLLSGTGADMVFTDPPYNVAYRAPKSQTRSGPARTILNDDLGTGFHDFLRKVCENMLRVTRGALYVCMSSSELHTLYRAYVEAGGHWSTFLIWGKSNFTLGRSDYQRQYEPILYGWRKGSQHYWCGARNQSDLWLVDKPPVNDLHPTMKPVALVERAIANSSRRGETVLDPFGGSGSSLIACEKTGRKARLMELDPTYCDVIIRRWQEFTGKKATRAADGHAFDDTAVTDPDFRLCSPSPSSAHALGANP
jgi:DNA modification methylase